MLRRQRQLKKDAMLAHLHSEPMFHSTVLDASYMEGHVCGHFAEPS